MTQNTEKFEGWAIVEMLGHKRIAGYLSEQAIGGGAMLRIDVPETKSGSVPSRWDADTSPDTAAYSKFVGIGSIYAITPCTEDVARKAARVIERSNSPIPLELPVPPQLSAGNAQDAELVPAGHDDDDDEDFFDDVPM